MSKRSSATDSKESYTRQLNREDRKAAMKYAFRNAGVDCVTVGYKNTAEIDEAVENLNLALA